MSDLGWRFEGHELGRVCELCDVLVTTSTIFAHYERDHPHLQQPEDWALKCWPDGEAMLIEIDPDIRGFM